MIGIGPDDFPRYHLDRYGAQRRNRNLPKVGTYTVWNLLADCIRASSRRWIVTNLLRFDRLRIYDGRSAAAPPLHQLAPPLHDAWGLSGLYDTEAVAQLRFNSSGDALLIRFDSDSSITESGFLLGWTPLTPRSGWQIAVDGRFEPCIEM